MHIVVIPSWYKTPKQPLYGSFFEEQARSLQQLGHKAVVLFPEYNPFRKMKLKHDVEFINDNGLPTYNLIWSAYMPRWRKINYPFFGKHVAQWFENYIREQGRPDIIHAHCVFSGGIAAHYISKRFGIPHVVTEHSTDFITQQKGFRVSHPVDIGTAKAVLKSTQQALVVSHAFADDLAAKLKLPRATFGVMPNMVNDLFLEIPLVKMSPKQEKFTFLNITFIDWRKNIKLLIDAFKIVLNHIPHATLTIGGDGDDRPILEKYIKTLNLEHKITLIGYLSRSQVAQAMQPANVFLFTSVYETFGVVLIEAMAAGKPIVSTNSGGPKDIVTPQNGLLVEKPIAEHFAAAMLEIYENYENFPAQNLRTLARETYSGSVVMQKSVEVYQKVIDRY